MGGGPKFFGRGRLTKGLHGRGNTCCRHWWIKYFHKHARITERSICYLGEDYFHDKHQTGYNTTYDSKLFKSSIFKENMLKLLYFGSFLYFYHFGRHPYIYSAKFQALNRRFVATYGSKYTKIPIS